MQWLELNHDSLQTEGPKINLTAQEISDAKDALAPYIAAMKATNTAEAALKAKRQAEKLAEAAALPAYRLLVRNWKTRASFPASGVNETLKLTGSEAAFDPSTYKPEISVSIEAGKILIAFEKKGVDRMAVYCRLRGTPGWTKLGEDKSSPYYDTLPLANPNVPEVREYMARGIVDDQEVGLDSDIVSIVFAG